MTQTFLHKSLLIAAAITTVALSASARQPESGYRGFADWTNRIYHQSYEYAYGDATYTWGKTYYAPGITTSHGYQFNPWLFVGAGIDISFGDIGDADHHAYSVDNNAIALFAEGRTDLKFGKFTPFADVRLGWNACEDGTVYFSPSIGYRFNWGRKVGINVGLGYTLDAYRYEGFILGQTPEGLTIAVPTGEHHNWTQSSFSFRVGFDF